MSTVIGLRTPDNSRMGAADGPALTGVQPAVEEALEAAARRWERLVGVARVLVSLVMLVRTVLIWLRWPDPERLHVLALHLAASALGIAASIALLRSRAPIKRLLTLSVTLDAAMVFFGFLPLVLWPWPYYPGIIATPDIAALFIVALAAGLRLSPRVAVYGAALNIVCLVMLLL